MCGRIGLRGDFEKLPTFFSAELRAELYPRYNVAPSQNVAVVLRRSPATGERMIELPRWGLVPFWAKDQSIGSRLINARAETVASKPAFRDAIGRWPFRE